MAGGRAGALVDVLGALDAEQLDRLVEVAVGLLEGLLAVHHPGTGEVPELLDVGGGVVRHCGASSSVLGVGCRASAVRDRREAGPGRQRISPRSAECRCWWWEAPRGR